jgi:hypothetical protein
MAGERDEVADEFVQFQDNSESPFYCADGISAVETWDRSVEAMADVLIELPQVTTEDFRLTAEFLSDWHRQIFGELFPDDAGRLRWRKEGRWEEVFFGGDVGTARSRRTKEYKGAHPRKLPDRVSEICDEFNEAREALIEAEPGFDSRSRALRVEPPSFSKFHVPAVGGILDRVGALSRARSASRRGPEAVERTHPSGTMPYCASGRPVRSASSGRGRAAHAGCGSPPPRERPKGGLADRRRDTSGTRLLGTRTAL